MTRITNRDGWLHHEDGSHRTTAPSANGSELETFERAIAIHRDRHLELDEVAEPDEALRGGEPS